MAKKIKIGGKVYTRKHIYQSKTKAKKEASHIRGSRFLGDKPLVRVVKDSDGWGIYVR